MTRVKYYGEGDPETVKAQIRIGYLLLLKATTGDVSAEFMLGIIDPVTTCYQLAVAALMKGVDGLRSHEEPDWQTLGLTERILAEIYTVLGDAPMASAVKSTTVSTAFCACACRSAAAFMRACSPPLNAPLTPVSRPAMAASM